MKDVFYDFMRLYRSAYKLYNIQLVPRKKGMLYYTMADKIREKIIERRKLKVKLHVLKQESSYYESVMDGNKKAELRVNDRDFKVGDIIHFTRVDGSEYSEHFNLFVITHILPIREIGIDNDYVMLSIERYLRTPYER